MPAHLVKRADLGKLYLPFLERLLELLARCEQRGAAYHITSDGGTRTFPQQAALYFQGRTKPGKKVTNAHAGYSVHNYGIGVDVVRDIDLVKPGVQPVWTENYYRILAEEGPNYGLQVGVSGLQDYGHIQLPLTEYEQFAGQKEAKILDGFRKIYLAAPKGQELRAVWEHLDSLSLW